MYPPIKTVGPTPSHTSLRRIASPLARIFDLRCGALVRAPVGTQRAPSIKFRMPLLARGINSTALGGEVDLLKAPTLRTREKAAQLHAPR